MKIATILGARPQFIKAAAVSRAIKEHNDKRDANTPPLAETIIHTGQHSDTDMSDVFFRELEIPTPDYNLGINSSSHGAMTGRMLEKIEDALITEKPDWVLVYGDTNSTLAGALAAVKLYIPVAHVEAGLRSFNRGMPEEINRVLTDHISTVLFCPTQNAVDNLQVEGIANTSSSSQELTSSPTQQLPRKVVLVGDVMYDSVLHNAKIAEAHSYILKKGDLKPKDYALATVHRAENTDQPQRLKSILQGLEKIAQGVLEVIIPVHPRTRSRLEYLRLNTSRLKLIPPVGYLDMLMLEKNARIILTDSGGMQKEAYWFEIPCVTLRDETEWVETVNAGWNVLVGADHEKIVNAANVFKCPPHHPCLYGDGRAAERIKSLLLPGPGSA